MELAICCYLTSDQHQSDVPVCIASRDKSYLKFDEAVDVEVGSSLVMQPFESLRMCRFSAAAAGGPVAMSQLPQQREVSLLGWPLSLCAAREAPSLELRFSKSSTS